MKKKSLLFGILTAALAIGSITFVSLLNKNSQPTELEAEAYNLKTSVQNGMFIKVTDANPIVPGEDLLIVGNGSETFQHLVGASYHYWVTTEYGGVAHAFGDAVFCHDSKGELVTLEDDGDPNTNDVYYLKLKHYVDNAHDGYHKVKSGYIVHEAYNNNGVTAFGDLYIRDKKNQPSKAAATWKITYGEESGSMEIRSMLDNRVLFWKPGNNYNWSSFACSTNLSMPSNVNFYRRVIDTSKIEITTTQHSNKEYYFGEKTDLEGLQINVKLNATITIPYYYNSNANPQLFKALNVSYIPQAGHFEWCGIPGQFTAVVKHDDRDMRTYNKATETLKDLRGSYVLGFQNAEGFVRLLDVKSLSSTPGKIVQPVRNTLPVTDYIIVSQDAAQDYRDLDVYDNEVQIVLEPIQENGDNEFLIKSSRTGEYLAPGPSGLVSKGPKDTDCAIMVNRDNHVIFNAHNQEGGWILAFDSRTDASQGYAPEEHVGKVVAVPVNSVESYHIPVELYKLQWTNNLKFAEDLDGFKETFFDNMTKFDRTGVTRNVEYSSWQIVKNAYNELPLDVKSYLACLTYTHNHEEEHTVEDMIDIYDTIYSTYYNVGNGFDDFMDRVKAGTLVHDRNVILNGTNCTITGESLACYNATYTARVQIANDYHYPEFVEVLMGNVPLEEGSQYTYDSSTGDIVIKANVIVDEITINAVAEFVGFNVVYLTGKGSSAPSADSNDKINVNGVANNTQMTLISFAESGFVAPQWQHFKAWKIGNTEYQPGATIVVTSDLIIEAVYEYDYESVDDIEEIKTIAALSYDYEKLGENNFTFSNLCIRFSGFLSKSAWDAIDEDLTIQGYGILLTTEDLFGAKLDSSNAQHNTYVDLATKPHPNFASDSLKTANEVEDITKEYYAWNLKANITEGYYDLSISAVAYLKTAKGYVFFNQVTTSVKDLAAEKLAAGADNREGSLNYLAN